MTPLELRDWLNELCESDERGNYNFDDDGPISIVDADGNVFEIKDIQVNYSSDVVQALRFNIA